MAKEQPVKYECRDLILHASLISVAADTVGLTLQTYSQREIENYFTDSKKYYPVCHKNPVYTDKNGSNSYLYVNTLEALANINPITEADIPDFVEEWSNLIGRFPSYLHPNTHQKWLRIKGNSDCGGFLPISLALAHYCAVTELPPSYLSLLLDALYSEVAPESYERDAVYFYATSILFLAYTGYFGHDLINKLYPNLDTDSGIARILRIINANAFDKEFYSAGFDMAWTDHLTYSELVVAMVVFYMMRVDTAYVDKSLRYSSSPRAQRAPILMQDYARRDDVFMAFSGLCLASEHNHPFLMKELRESNVLCGRIKQLFAHI